LIGSSSRERTENGEEGAADHVGDTQRHHRPHQQGGDEEARADRSEQIGECNVVDKDLQQPVEDRVVGDVVGIETHLDQDLCDPEVIRGRFENAVKDGRNVCAAGRHGTNPA
jgi:hypothetical protein